MKRDRSFGIVRLIWLPVAVATVMVLSFHLPAYGQSPASKRTREGSVMNGWRLFNSKQCIACHAIWDRGGTLAPDLGRIHKSRSSEGQLVGILWNHVPKILDRAKQIGRQPSTLSSAEMADLFALLDFAHQIDEPGDPVRGERTLHIKDCSKCHSIDSVKGHVGSDLVKWGRYANPVILAEKMWKHAPMMQESVKRSNLRWPDLNSDDLVNIVAYLRDMGPSDEKLFLHPGSIQQGRRLFAEKKCRSCHPGKGPDLAHVELPHSMGALATRMWKHSPETTRVMFQEQDNRQPVKAQELVDILGYVLAIRQQDEGGDPAHGRQLFQTKGCIQCHQNKTNAQPDGPPPLNKMSHTDSPASMAAAMWNHSEAMFDHSVQGVTTWPKFEGREMVDLLAFLRASSQTDSVKVGDARNTKQVERP